MAQPSRLGRYLRRIGLGIGVLVLVVVAVAAYTLATFNPDSLKPRLVAEVRALTGRTLVLSGPIRLHLSLHPSLAARDVSLANPPGFSRPEMVRLGALSLGIDALGLLHGQVVVNRLTLTRPDILLERTRTGAVNWRFAPPAAPAPGKAAPAAAPAPASGAGVSVFVRSVRLVDATLGYRDDATGKTTVLHLPALALTEASPTAPLVLVASGTLGAAPVALHVTTGTLTALLAGAAVPLRAQLDAAGARLGLVGRIARPLAGSGIALEVTAAVPSLRAVGQLAGASLPAIRLGLHGQLALPGTPAEGGQLRGLRLSLPGGTIGGDLALRLGAVPAVSGTLSAATLDADTLLAALRGPASATHAPPAAAGAGASAPAAGGYVIPTTPLP
ncbi:MAG: AsmA family protein, partial [Acetobacteraceae bacterium]